MYSYPECKNTFFTKPQAQGGHITRRKKIMDKKGKAKLDLQSVPHKCKVCNHVCQTGQELSFHMMSVRPQPGTHVCYYNINEKPHNINTNGIIITYSLQFSKASRFEVVLSQTF